MRVVLVTAPPSEAPELARALVTDGYAACVNLLPVRSVYWWDGQVHDDSEVTMIIKVKAEGVPALRERVLELHSYSVPEFVVLDVDTDESSPAYVNWVRKTARNSGGP